jgi:hypothetical protein
MIETYTCRGQLYTLTAPDWTAIADAWIDPDAELRT